MKKVFFVMYILLVMSMLYAVDRAFFITPEQMEINAHTEAIYYRYYLIKRLEVAMHLLEKSGAQKSLFVDQIDENYSHHIINEAIKHMQHEKSIAPVVLVWQMFASYQYVGDQVFNKEFVYLVFFLYEHIVYQKRKEVVRGAHIEYILNAIDYLIIGQPIERRLQETYIQVKTDHISQCFFVGKRLEKTMRVLLYIYDHEKVALQERGTTSSFDAVVDELGRFSHHRVREAIIGMERTKSLAPLVQVCAEYRQYRFAADDLFLKEMLMHIFLVYKSLLFKQLSAATEQVIMTEMQQVLELYEHIEEMPLDETLEAIDMVTDKLVAIQQMQAQKWSTAPWVASGVFCAACLGIFYWFQR